MHDPEQSPPLTAVETDALFDEFQLLFRLYRADGRLKPDDRARFRALAVELTRRGLLGQNVAVGWMTPVGGHADGRSSGHRHTGRSA
jgi:hypothetical protein